MQPACSSSRRSLHHWDARDLIAMTSSSIKVVFPCNTSHLANVDNEHPEAVDSWFSSHNEAANSGIGGDVLPVRVHVASQHRIASHLVSELLTLPLLFSICCAPEPASRTVSNEVELSHIVPLTLPSGSFQKQLLCSSLCCLANSLSRLAAGTHTTSVSSLDTDT